MADDARNGRTRWKARVGNIIYWLLSGIAILLILNAYDGAHTFDIGHTLAGGVLYFIGRDLRRVLTGAA